MMTPQGSYDEALLRLHTTGPEFEGWLSNHGPMAVEALARRGSSAAVHAWTDGYVDRLDVAPTSRFPVGPDDWHHDFGNAVLLGEWRDFFLAQVAEQGWADTVATWWPRLLPGIASGATHGVIRLGHAIQAVRTEATQPRLDEIAHALGYWAARWEPVAIPRAGGAGDARTLLEAMPAVPDQRFGIRYRLPQLASTPGFGEAVESLPRPATAADVPAALAAVVDATVAAYPRIAHGHPTLLVHAATAPNAVLMALPSLPETLWLDGLDAAWTATAAVVAAYRPRELAPAPSGALAQEPEEVWSRVLADGGEHIVKFADTALGSWERTGDPAALAAIDTAIRLGA